MEPPWEGGKKVYINGPGHMTKMTATPINEKKPSKIFFSRAGRPMILKLVMQHQGLKLYKVYINDDPGLALNPRPPAPEADALPFALSGPVYKPKADDNIFLRSPRIT